MNDVACIQHFLFIIIFFNLIYLFHEKKLKLNIKLFKNILYIIMIKVFEITHSPEHVFQ